MYFINKIMMIIVNTEWSKIMAALWRQTIYLFYDHYDTA